MSRGARSRCARARSIGGAAAFALTLGTLAACDENTPQVGPPLTPDVAAARTTRADAGGSPTPVPNAPALMAAPPPMVRGQPVRRVPPPRDAGPLRDDHGVPPPTSPPSMAELRNTAMGAYLAEITALRRGLGVEPGSGAGIAGPVISALQGAPQSSDIPALTALKGRYEAASRMLLKQHAPDAVKPHRLVLLEALTLATTYLGKRLVAASTGDSFLSQAKRAETKLRRWDERIAKRERAVHALLDGDDDG